MKYIAIDVETPNLRCSTICQIGCVLIDDDEIIDKWSSFVNPEDYFDDFCIGIHGITPDDVKSAPTFPSIWMKIKELSKNRVFIAHNARFDIGVLKKCIERYNLPSFTFDFTCTLMIARKLCKDLNTGKGSYKLNVLAQKLGIDLNKHHDASFDALCCGQIFIKLKNQYGFDDEDFRYSSLANIQYNNINNNLCE